MSLSPSSSVNPPKKSFGWASLPTSTATAPRATDVYKRQYYEMSSDDIAFNQDDIISYTVSFENYTGGAHGAHSYNNHVVNLKTGKPITEEEIFVDNYQDNLARILVDQIAKQNNVSDAKEDVYKRQVINSSTAGINSSSPL